MPRISVDLDGELYDKLDALKYRVSGTGGTHAAVMRAALGLLLEAHAACAEGLVVGAASGPRQRLRRVMVQHEHGRIWLDFLHRG